MGISRIEDEKSNLKYILNLKSGGFENELTIDMWHKTWFPSKWKVKDTSYVWGQKYTQPLYSPGK